MANAEIRQLVDSVNAQVAAEAFLTTAGLNNRGAFVEALIEGNGNASKFPESLAGQFSSTVSVRAHIDFSLNEGKNPLGSAITDKSGLSATLFFDSSNQTYVLSIRSTEAALGLSGSGDNILDPGDVNADLEIARYGYAFAQISQLQTFFEATVKPIVGDAKIDVTGFSLGGHLATVFTELNPGAVTHTYLFNGAGTGSTNIEGGITSLLDLYDSVFEDPTSYFGSDPVAVTNDDVRPQLQLYLANPNATYTSVYDDPRHKLALIAAAGFTTGAAIATLQGVRVANPLITDAYGANGLSVTAASGIRHGTALPVYIEDQPVISTEDYASAHSIALLQDSLALAATLEKLDPNLTIETFNRILEAGSDQSWTSLEQTLDSVRALVLGIDKVDADDRTPAGSSSAAFSDINLREAFHANLLALNQEIDERGLAGTINFVPLDGVSGSSLADLARTQLSYRYALQELNSFVALGFDYAAINADGALDISANGIGVTDAWISARAEMLSYLMAHNVANGNEAFDPAQPFNVDQRQGIQIGSIAGNEVFFAGNLGSNRLGSVWNDLLFGGAGNDTLNGGIGADYLEGKTGQDVLIGGTGNDTLISLDGAGGDHLVGGTGYDTFVVDWGDTISDDPEGPRGGIIYVGADRLQLGDGFRSDDSSFFTAANGVRYWEGSDGRLVAYLPGSSTQVMINRPNNAVPGREDFGDHEVTGRPDLGIRLVTQHDGIPSVQLSSSIGELFHLGITFRLPADPLAIDLDGDGLETLGGPSSSTTILFDHSGDGVRDGTAWLNGDDAWLAFDRDGDGMITTGAELFGIDTILPDGTHAPNAFAALAPLDTNANGLIDAGDEGFGRVLVWRDQNVNGVSESFELSTLEGAGIVEIRLDATPTGVRLGDGSILTMTSSFVRADGTTGQVGAIDLLRDTFVREFSDPPASADTDEALPNIAGTGRVRNLDEASAESIAVAADLHLAASADTRDTQLSQSASLVSSWADDSPMATGSQAALSREGQPLVYYRFADLASESAQVAYLAVTDGHVDPATLPAGWYVQRQSAEYQERVRELEVLERFGGQTFADVLHLPTFTEYSAPGVELRTIAITIRPENWQFLKAAYEALTESTYLAVTAQTRLSTYVEAFMRGEETGEFSEIESMLAEKHATDPAGAITDLFDLSRALGVQLVERGWINMPVLFQNWLREASTDPSLNALLNSLGVQFRHDSLMNGTANSDVLLGGAWLPPFPGGVRATFAGFGNDLIFGGEASATEIHDGPGRDVILGGPESTTYLSGAGHDIILFGRDSGTDFIQPEFLVSPISVLDRDTIQFLPGIAPADLIVRHSGVALEIRIRGTTAVITDLQATFGGEGDFTGGIFRTIEDVRFADGTVWSADILQEQALIGGEEDDNGTTYRALTGYPFADDLIRGNGGNDVLDGRGGNDELLGGTGNDALFGGTGNDTLDGGAGNDQLDGGVGVDTYVFTAAGGRDRIASSGTAELDVLRIADGIAPGQLLLQRTPEGIRIFLGDGSSEILDGGNALNSLYTASGANGPSFDRVEFADGTVWNAFDIRSRLLTGTSADDAILGFNDQADVIGGLAGADRLMGLGGNDELTGGIGNDRLEGGAGADIYVFRRGDGQDTIIDDSGAVNVLSLPDIAPGGVTRVNNVLTVTGTEDRITIEGNGAIGQIVFSDGSTSALTEIQGPPSDGGGTGGGGTGGGGSGGGLGGGGGPLGVPTDGDDVLFGTPSADVLAGGRGNDILVGDAGSDTYFFALGDGFDIFIEEGTGSDEPNFIRFGPGIGFADLRPEEIQGAIFIHVGSGTDAVAFLPGTIAEVRLDTGESKTVGDLLNPPEPPLPEPEPEPEGQCANAAGDQASAQPQASLPAYDAGPAPSQPSGESSKAPPLARQDQDTAIGDSTSPLAAVPNREADRLTVERREFPSREPVSGVSGGTESRVTQPRFEDLLEAGRVNFTERYADAIREFEGKRAGRDVASLSVDPIPLEIEAWNTAMHSWHERNPGFSETDLSTADAGWAMGWGLPVSATRELEGNASGVAPGLGNPETVTRLSGVTASPGLREGLRQIL